VTAASSTAAPCTALSAALYSNEAVPVPGWLATLSADPDLDPDPDDDYLPMMPCLWGSDTDDILPIA